MTSLAVYRTEIKTALKLNAKFVGCAVDYIEALWDNACWVAHTPVLRPGMEALPACYARNLEDLMIRYMGPDISRTLLPEIEDDIYMILFLVGKCKIILNDDGEGGAPIYDSFNMAVNTAALRQKYKHEKGKPNANL